jgi:glucokinase-like ROK family protein
VEDLLAGGIVQEVGYGKTVASGGRRARLLEFNEASAAYLGIRLGVHTTTVAIADGRGELRAMQDVRSIVGDPERLLSTALEAVDDVLEAADVPRERLQAAGVIVPGLIDAESGACVLAPNLGWENFPLRQVVHERLGIPVVVHNVTNAGAAAEGKIGAAKGYRSFVWVYVGTGVGAGVVLDGHLFCGRQGFSGEVGHCKVVDDGLECGCGARGCLETLASGKAIEREARSAVERGEATRLADLGGYIEASQVAAVARDGDPVAQRILATAGEYLGIGISYLQNILNPEIVVVGGNVVEAGDLFLGPARRSAAQRALSAEAVQIVASDLGERAGIVGAVLLAMDHSVQSYRIVATNSPLVVG